MCRAGVPTWHGEVLHLHSLKLRLLSCRTVNISSLIMEKLGRVATDVIQEGVGLLLMLYRRESLLEYFQWS